MMLAVRVATVALMSLFATCACSKGSPVSTAAAPSTSAPKPEAVAVSTAIPDVRIAAVRELPSPKQVFPVSENCSNDVIEPRSAGGKDALAKGWHVNGEVPLGDLEAVSIFNEAGDGTSGLCLIIDGNVVVYRGGQLLAIAYGERVEDTVGILGGVSATGFANRVRLWPGSEGSPVADLVLTSGGLAVSQIAEEEPACDGRVTLPNIYDLDIGKARARLMQHGWIPVPALADEIDTWDRVKEMRAKGWVEVQGCSGTGMGYCGLDYRHASGATLSVTTAGDESSVIYYSAQCRTKSEATHG
jgi:hypothetical protein